MNYAIPVQSIWEKYASIRKKINYLDKNHFCLICGNTSYNTNYCDHCGVGIDSEVDSNKSDEFTVSCPECKNIYDDEISSCPNCSASIR
jgi:ribosomal protein L37E